MTEVVVTTGAVRHCKAAVKWSPRTSHQQTAFYRPDVPPVAQPTVSKSTEGKVSLSHELAHSKLTWGLPTLSLATKSSC